METSLIMGILGLFGLSVALLTLTGGVYSQEEDIEYPPFDGWYNNWATPSWGGAETHMFRRVSSQYGDGVYEPAGGQRPNPIELSQALMNGSTGTQSPTGRTALLVFFGQQITEEIVDAQRAGCPPEYFNIKIPEGHPQYDPKGEGGKEMPVLRGRYDFNTGSSPSVPRQQLNEISAFIDGTVMYGPNKAWADALRLHKDGLLASTMDDPDGLYSDKDFPRNNDFRLPFANPAPPRDHMLKPIKRFFMIGNPRGNENPYLLTFGILWYRHHNWLARRLKDEHPGWKDEKLYNEARKWNIATYQRIVMYEWLPAFIGPGEQVVDRKYEYTPTLNPQISFIFQSAAMRFGHTMVPPGVYRRNAQCEFNMTTKATKFEGFPAVRTCNVYWNPQEAITEYDIDEFLMGMASQVAEKEDNIITPDLRGDLFGPLEFPRRDLMALNIQRGRDFGLPDYNTARVEMGLEEKVTFQDIVPDSNPEKDRLVAELNRLYQNRTDDIDIWVGGLLETTEAGPGELFRKVILDQFRRLRDGDRFWFENRMNRLFNETEIDQLNQTTLRDVILRVTNIPPDRLQPVNVFFKAGDPCMNLLPPLQHENLSVCTPGFPEVTFDYFSESSLSYILSFVALGVIQFGVIGALIGFAKQRDKQKQKQQRMKRGKTRKDDTIRLATEWVSKKELRPIKLKLDSRKGNLQVMSNRNKPLRTIDFTKETSIDIVLGADVDSNFFVVKLPREHDLAIIFDSRDERNIFQDKFENFLKDRELGRTIKTVVDRKLTKEIVTKLHRQTQLDKFFRAVFSHAIDKIKAETEESLYGTSEYVGKISPEEAHAITQCELTKTEFAESLGLKPSSLFAENMFNLVDKNESGTISYREFMDFIIIFLDDDADKKLMLLFEMYDIDGKGHLSKTDFKTMLRSLMELANADLSNKLGQNENEDKLDHLINTMFKKQGLDGKQELSFEDFQDLLGNYQEEFNVLELNVNIGSTTLQAKEVSKPNTLQKPEKDSAISRARKTLKRAYSTKNKPNRLTTKGKTGGELKVQTIQQSAPMGKFAVWWNGIVRRVENEKLYIFWATLYTLVTLGVFIERSYYYSVEREHGGLRRVAGYGVTVTRGAASAMMFTYSSLLVTMCRNLFTRLRETMLNRYIPFDSFIDLHKYIAYLALFFTIMHIIGHAINFYHISTQTAVDLICLFRNFFHGTDELPKFHRWLWQTLTGFTGVVLTVIVMVMYTFALQYARRKAFRAFWITHQLYVVLFIFSILHGMGRLVQPPFMHYFMLGPVIMFTLDKLVSISRKRVEIAVKKAELLPSDVCHLEFERPNNFDYKSGQWVKIACPSLNAQEYHPFTLSSAPHEENLSLHIRAVGPWTMNLQDEYHPERFHNDDKFKFPPIYLDGPYGEGHQEWYKYDVAILVGGGIGVTPFASILKDLAHKSEMGIKINCRKVYFLWITRTQKQFEWLIDIMRDVESKDHNNLVAVHTFITQFKQKYDLRTIMLYICERHFQRIAGHSLFTGLKSITHFGRPDFDSLFEAIQDTHKHCQVFGVFSCGPPPMTNSVERACKARNEENADALFVHHYENF